MSDTELRMKQIVVAQFSTTTGMSYSTLALSEDGILYRYDPKCQGWLRFPMGPTDDCAIGIEHSR